MEIGIYRVTNEKHKGFYYNQKIENPTVFERMKEGLN